MSKTMSAVLLCLLAAPSARAQYLETYFNATSAGSWARYELTTTDPKGKSDVQIQTLSRLPDDAGNVVLEVHTEPAGQADGAKKKKSNKREAMTVQMHLKPGFLKELNPLNYMGHVERMILQKEGAKAQEMPMDMLRSMAGGAVQMLDYGSNVGSEGSEELQGIATKKYRVSGTLEMKVVFKQLRYAYVSDLWLASSIPFGRVQERTEMKDEKGQLRSTSATRLLEHGESGAASRIQGPIEKIEMPSMPALFGK